jgi:hypothetical protein
LTIQAQKKKKNLFDLLIVLFEILKSKNRNSSIKFEPTFLLLFAYNHQGDGSSARNLSARKPVFQANLQIRLAVFETTF